MPNNPPFAISELPGSLSDCLQTLDDRKAADLTLLDVRGISSLTDFLVIASANSEPHLKALVNSVSRELKGNEYFETDHSPGSGWAVVDAVDYMVHIFEEAQRDYYQLERLWNDAGELPVEDLLGIPNSES
ncbi:MAG: ribosome silencing factor [Opitutales bacterium]